MFNIGGSEMILLAVLALLVFGPEGLPDIMKTVARTIRAFKAAANDFQSEVNSALILENQKKQVEQRRRKRVLPEGETATEQAPPSEGEGDSTPGSSSEIDLQDSEDAPPLVAGETLAAPEAPETSEQATSIPEAPPGENGAISKPALNGASADAAPSPVETSTLLSGDAPYSEPADGDEDGPGRPMSRSRVTESEPPAADLETVS